VRRARGSFDFLSGTNAGIGITGRNKFVYRVSIENRARSLINRSRIPIEPEPLKVVHQRTVGFPFYSWTIDILNSEQDSPAILTGKKPVDEESPGVSQMQGAGRRWGKARQSCHIFRRHNNK
jgi:hypothetical protein